jgi:hypothetical protein
VSNLLFFSRSVAYRHAALEMMRKARAMPPGPLRGPPRQLARALLNLAKTEAWLEGQTARPRSLDFTAVQPRRAINAGALDVRSPKL